MGAILNYMLHVAAFMTAFYLVYKWLMADTTFYRVNRVILLSVYLLSWVLPLFSMSVVEFGSGASEPAPDVALEIGALRPVIIMEEPAASPFEVWVRVFIWIYVAGVAVFAASSLAGCFRLWRIVRSGTPRESGGASEIITPAAPGPFSWAGYVVLRPEDTGENYDLISAHERAHIRLGHWLDLVLAQVTLVFQWFSPAAWLMVRSLKENHEYEVDRIVAGDDPVRYQIMLIKMTVGSRLPLPADSLNHSQLKKRLTMMMTKKSSSSRRFATFALPAAAALTLVALSQPSVARVSEIMSSTPAWPAESPVSAGKDTKTSANVQNIPATVMPDQAAYAADDPAVTPGAGMEAEKTGTEATGPDESGAVNAPAQDAPEEKPLKNPAVFIDGKLYTGSLADVPSETVQSMVVVKNDPAYPGGKIMVETKGSAKATSPEPDDKVYQTAERIAEYNGEMPALLKFLADNLNCPDDLKETKRVIVNFTVCKDGSVTDVKVLRSGGEQCDAEAIRAVKLTSGNWIPAQNDGKPVACKFTLPVVFKYEAPAEKK